MKSKTTFVSILTIILIVFIAVTCKEQSSEPENTVGTVVIDSDSDGVPDNEDQCPTLYGESKYSGCPWWKVDECSESAPYTYLGSKWCTLTPAICISTNFPEKWRSYIAYAGATWNAVKSRLEIKYNSTLKADIADDAYNVVCYGTLPSGVLGKTYWWQKNNCLTNVDIKINSTISWSINPSGNEYDMRPLKNSGMMVVSKMNTNQQNYLPS